MRCADLVAALESLRRGDAAMLETLAWRGTEGERDAGALARRPGDADHGARSDAPQPWGGVAGCIYLGGEGTAGPGYFLAPARSAQQRVCGMAAVRGAAQAASGAAPARPPIAVAGEPGPADPVDDPRWKVPPSLFTLLQPLESLRQPSGALYRAYAANDDELPRVRAGRIGSRNHVDLDGAAVDVGYSIDLTIDPGAAGAGAEDGRLLHRPPRRLPRARHAPRRGRRSRRSARSSSKARWCGWPRSR